MWGSVAEPASEPTKKGPAALARTHGNYYSAPSPKRCRNGSVEIGNQVGVLGEAQGKPNYAFVHRKHQKNYRPFRPKIPGLNRQNYRNARYGQRPIIRIGALATLHAMEGTWEASRGEPPNPYRPRHAAAAIRISARICSLASLGLQAEEGCIDGG